MPVITYLNPLDKETLKEILTKPKNAIIKQYQKLLELEDVKLEFDEDVIDYLAEKAIDLKLGARGLRSIIESIMLDSMFDIPSADNKIKHLKIDKSMVVSKLSDYSIGHLRVAS